MRRAKTGTAGPKGPADAEAPVVDAYRAISRLLSDSALPQADRAANGIRAEIVVSTLSLCQLPAVTPYTLQLKLALLCQRLREDLHPEISGELAAYLLAESIREDCRLLADGAL